jgi:hypothetical protein
VNEAPAFIDMLGEIALENLAGWPNPVPVPSNDDSAFAAA